MNGRGAEFAPGCIGLLPDDGAPNFTGLVSDEDAPGCSGLVPDEEAPEAEAAECTEIGESGAPFTRGVALAAASSTSFMAFLRAAMAMRTAASGEEGMEMPELKDLASPSPFTRRAP